MNHAPRSSRPVGVIVFLAVIGSSAAEADEPSQDSGDCGTVAIYTLLQLEGRPTPLETIATRLPNRRPDGHSMKELRDAAWSFGLWLDGAYLGKDAEAIDRPMLAFLKVDHKGHFLVVRPVGHTGKLAQVIDSNQPTGVMDKTDLVASDQWTGLVLAPRRTDWPAVAALGLLAPACLGGIVLALFRGRTGKSREIIDRQASHVSR